MVRDPWLHALRTSSGAYVLTELRPVSVRDQILRGVHLADRLVARGRLRGRRFGIVGGGAAGMAAALHAAQSGVDTVIFERDAVAFPLQLGTRGRWLDPIHYDWPCDHYSSGLSPLGTGTPSTPLPVSAGTPNQLGLRWDGALHAYLTSGSANLDVRLSTAVTATHRVPGGFEVTQAGKASPEFFDVLVFAVGRVGEDTTVSGPSGPYVGQPFWSLDRLLHFRSPWNRILISGGGDGGLQDYLRAVLNLEDFSGLARSLRLPSDVVHLVQSAEDRAFREASWEAKPSPSTAPVRKARYGKLAFATGIAVRRALRFRHVGTALDLLLRVGGPSHPQVNLVYRDRHPTAWYPLNRFLVALISEHLRTTRGIETVFPEVEITDLSPLITLPTGAAGTPGGALGYPHRATFAGAGTPPPNPDFDVIAIRHGPGSHAAKSLLRSGPVGQPCQLLPYGV